jgi:hypothetical protein
MKSFTTMQIDEARAYAAAGGQALHCHRIIVDWQKAPACFRREVEAGRDIAHLFDQDLPRLVNTARQLGVRIIVVENRGTPSMHIDLCGGPLRKAKALCERDADEVAHSR